jgi:hypothetical protein
VAKDRITIQSPDPGVGTPPQIDSRLSDILHIEVGKLQNDGEHIKSLLGEVRVDVKEVRDRLIKLETNVSHLPGKGFIIVVVTSALLIGGAIASGLFGLQNYLSSKQPVAAPAQATQSVPVAPLPQSPPQTGPKSH